MGADVVVAPATPPGRSALAVVRLSGHGCAALVARFAVPVAPGPLRPGRRRVRFVDASGPFDDGVLWLGLGPDTPTGEDLAELTCHGNPVIVAQLVEAAVAAGARVAGPGEFTRRALVNGRIDLVGAEGVLQAIDAAGRAGLAVARQALDGAHAAAYADVRAALVDVAAELEARLDHPGEDLLFAADDALDRRLDGLALRCRELAGSFDAGRRLVDGARVALVGPVNAGKSSLFNALLGRRRALVHATPGTTRDVLEARASVGGAAITLLDTAGERETDDPVEAAGLALGRELAAEVDLRVVVVRAGRAAEAAPVLAATSGSPRLVVLNAVDEAPGAGLDAPHLRTSARTGEGVDALAGAIAAALGGEAPASGELVIASARQRDLLLAVARACDAAREALGVAGPAVAAEAVHAALAELDALTGADAREAVLDALFARFCVGK